MPARDERFYFHLQRTAHILQKRADKRVSAAADVTTAQAAVLSLLKERQGCTQKWVAETLAQNESAITAMIRRLIALGYVEKRADAEDKRAVRLSLTEAGAAALEATKAPFSEINRMIDACLAPDEIAALTGYLRRLATAALDAEP